MSEYSKIQTLFLRDPATNMKTLLEGVWAKPEFGLLKDAPWVWTEKVDGTNVRVIWDDNNQHLSFGGKTDNAQIPAPLVKHLMDTFTLDKVEAVFRKGSIVLYGEGFGPKIQNGGRYRSQPDFVLFDALAGDIWLERSTVEDIGIALGIPVAPIIEIGTPLEAVEFVRQGFKSVIADDKTLDAEGLVLRPAIELKDRLGKRIITKIKHKDFVTVAQKTQETVEATA